MEKFSIYDCVIHKATKKLYKITGYEEILKYKHFKSPFTIPPKEIPTGQYRIKVYEVMDLENEIFGEEELVFLESEFELHKKY